MRLRSLTGFLGKGEASGGNCFQGQLKDMVIELIALMAPDAVNVEPAREGNPRQCKDPELRVLVLIFKDRLVK